MWITTAQQHMSPGVTMKGLKKHYISTAVDVTYDLLQSGSKRSECQGKGTDCVEADRDTNW